MSFRDDLIGVLSGGLPTLLEIPDAPTQASTQPEQTAPSGTIRDVEPFSLNTVTQTQILGVTAGILALLGVIWVIRK